MGEDTKEKVKLDLSQLFTEEELSRLTKKEIHHTMSGRYCGSLLMNDRVDLLQKCLTYFKIVIMLCEYVAKNIASCEDQDATKQACLE